MAAADTKTRQRAPLIQREVIALALLSALAVGGFLMTRAAAAAHQRLRLRDAAELYERGQQALAAGHFAAAVDVLRRASAIDVDARGYKLALARALVADNRIEPARQVLVSLRARVPEDPSVNLQLARLEAGRGDGIAAVSYYHHALYGAWGTDEIRQRQNVRVELVRYLLDRGDRRRAVSELLVLGANLPDDVDAQRETAELFLMAGDASHAPEHYDRVLEERPRDQRALAGAARAAFALQDYRRVIRFVPADTVDPDLAALRDISEAVQREDPLQPRLARAERVRRVQRGVSRALERFAACAAVSAADVSFTRLHEALLRARHGITVAAVRDTPDLLDDGVALVARAQQRADAICGGSGVRDRAWAAIARLHHLSPS
jgi:tetratricopeptide (TPR) repeat protein